MRTCPIPKLLYSKNKFWLTNLKKNEIMLHENTKNILHFPILKLIISEDFK